MAYSRTNYGPGDIGALRSGIGLTMGPTIGSNDPRIPLSGFGHGMGITGFTIVPGAIEAAMAARGKLVAGQAPAILTTNTNQESDSVDLTQSTTDEPPITDEVITPPSGVPTWAWVVGGVVGLGLIGGIAYTLLK